MTYRLLACDIDDTLVRFPAPPSPRVAQALRKAVEAGVVVALVTGRAFRRAWPIAQALGVTAPLICNHGSSIRDTLDGRVIHRETVPRSLMLEVVTWMQSQGVCLLLFEGDYVYRDCAADQVVADFQVYTQEDQSAFFPDLHLHIPQETDGLLVTWRDRAHLDRVFEGARARFGDRVRVLFAHPYGVDVLARDTSKSRALIWLADHIGAAREQVMAVGDGSNDVDMLAWAGLGVAMGDGAAEAKAVADVIAPPFDQDGAAWAIERYILPALGC